MITPPNCLAREFYRTGQVKGLVSIDCGLWWAGLSYCAISISGWSRWVGGCDDCGVITGSPAGHIGLVDYDVVELSNLHRQVIKN